ncbi:membrane protein insertion efficiency factor YidD [Nocardioides sp. NPDC000445]|uniref:membrane protein insertion efficiency factor YidD n=1 Tax=Nocardioides sp. NPDC000445 TaxID=3154257 RepID=UPI00331F033E
MSTAARVVRGGLAKLDHLVAAVLIGLLHVWRTLISPLYGDVCRYYPSCSAYGLEAVKTHGPWRGSWLTARRLARCVPWAKTRGFDPVPTPKKYRRDPEDLVRVSADSPNRGA